MPTFSPELLRYLELIAAPFRHLAQDDASFAMGRLDKEMAGKPNTLPNIAAKYSRPGRGLKITPNGDDPGDMYRIEVPGVRGQAEAYPPHLDVIRNYDYNYGEGPPKYDIDAGSASHGAKGKGAAVQMYPAAWDLIKANEGTDMTSMLTQDNYLRKPAALLSYLLRGNHGNQVPLSGEMFLGMDTGNYPEVKALSNHLTEARPGTDPLEYYFAPGGNEKVRTNSAALSPDQRIGGLALAEAAKVQARIGSMNHQVQDLWHDAQWPIEGPKAFTNNFSPFLSKESLQYLGTKHKIGDPTLRRAMMTDWLARRARAGATNEDTLPLLDTDQAKNYGRDMFYAQGGLAQCHACMEAEKMAAGGAAGKKVGEGYQPVRSTFGYVHDSFENPVWSRDFNNTFDPHPKPSESLPVNPDLMRVGQALGRTPDPIVKQIQTKFVNPQGFEQPEVRKFNFDHIIGQPLDDHTDNLQLDEFDPELHDALQELELMKQ